MSIPSWCEFLSNGYACGAEAQPACHPDRRDGLQRRQILAGLLGAALLSFRAPSAKAADSPKEPPLIMLDPGHGGHDPGAIGASGLFEKHVALTAARDLKTALEQDGRYRVMMTREDDVFLPLEQRTAYGQAHNARLFVSLHADALTDHSIRGASVYTLALHASDAQSDELARRENSVDPAAMKEYSNYSPDVADILASLTRRETRVLSARLQKDLVQSFSREILMLHHSARRANFVVLRSFEIPSVLVEMGFMSNKADEMLLQTAAHREQVVISLQHGIETCMTSLALMTSAG